MSEKDDGFTDGGEGNSRQLEVLQTEGNPENRNAENDPPEEMNQGQPEAAKHKPQNIAQKTEKAGANVRAADLDAIDDVGAKGPKI